jgi:hypothetical protein
MQKAKPQLAIFEADSPEAVPLRNHSELFRGLNPVGVDLDHEFGA